MNTSSLCIYISFLCLFSIPSGLQSRFWSLLPLWRQECMGVGTFSKLFQKQNCLPPESPCMHVFFTRQGDIMKLGLENSSLSWAFLKTLPPISFCSIFIWPIQSIFKSSCFNYNWTKTAKIFKNKSCPSRVKRLVTLTFNYKLYRISDDLLISEQ